MPPCSSPIITSELVTRIERALTLAAESRVAHIQLLPGNPLDIESRRWESVTATLVRREVGYYQQFNAIRGIGPGCERLFDKALGWFRNNDARCSVAVSPFKADERLLRHLADRGLRQSRFMSVLYGVPQSMQPPRPAGITVRALQSPELDPFLVIWQAGAPDSDWELLKPIGAAEFNDWQCYLAFVGNQPAAIAALYLRDGLGIMASAVTLPELRGRGCQTALLHERMAHAAAAGCDLVVSQAEPGSGSQRNLERVGLRTAYTQAIWSITSSVSSANRSVRC